jgi:hypothetical protein
MPEIPALGRRSVSSRTACVQTNKKDHYLTNNGNTVLNMDSTAVSTTKPLKGSV